ncbi:sodium- and chloride-dependent taurine transporter-like isoform X2 [Physella acuta]|nr:sodium- and chloride-dependent taurine transporter-like isoform X2 [Physella acuta]XP_059150823.1 sodium- and chloride-dependent taurine transporter-like isoform X2 [Physella acuta]XP_059150834.1 sodium- and chloride-dependent taurine transporter-like isoform X2 [Physella acuta]XP_059150845.1 sodium- and chloride-dependent taurine transporter-like isoform X2 [Physella acuta]
MKAEAADEVSRRGTIRETWSKAIDFLLACIGFSVGLGNVWRFPYLCFKNGGGAFLIPYFLSVIFGGIPLFYLEVAIGQFMSQGGLQAWKIVPLFQGIGLSSCIIVFFLNCYYNVILAWAFYYFFASFTSELPWQGCNHTWNTPSCSLNFSQTSLETGRPLDTLTDPVTEYWENKVLAITDGIDDVGILKWDLTLCLLLAWVVVYLCICKGIKSSGKVMYVTATSPYLFMVILLVRNSMLDGAADGVEFYLKPNLTKLGETTVWVDAGTQIFFSSSIALGTLTALGSYNKFTHNSYRDSILFACVNSGTSFFAGFIVFTILGFMAKQQGKSIGQVAESGPGLAFIAYPSAVAQMPLAPLWSVFFFLMLILLGLDSQFVGVEGVVTTIVDQYPETFRKGWRKEILTAVCCAIMFLIGLSMVSEGGMYVFQVFDYYTGSRIIMLVAFFELVAISYVYGIRRFYENVVMMVGHSWMRHTLPYMLICWTVLAPIFCMAVFVLSTIDYSELTYSRPGHRMYVYPPWGVAIGWTMAGFAAIWIPVVGLYNFCRYGATWEVFKLLLVPYSLEKHQKRPADENERCLHHLLQERQLASAGSVTCQNGGYVADAESNVYQISSL